MENIEAVQQQIGYTFKDQELLKSALSHSSYANENHCDNNERLEFLGDSVLSLIISDSLFRKYGHVNEGRLSKIRASLVCEQSLASVAEKISLGDLLLLGKGEEKSGGRTRPSIVSDAFEALIAAIYLDSGMKAATKWVLGLMNEEIIEAEQKKDFGDFKTQLQELVQQTCSGSVLYRVVKEEGQDHLKTFTVAAFVDGKKLGTGVGSSKKVAEQLAAAESLKMI